MALYLAEHPEELQRIDRLSPITAMRELGKIEARLEGQVAEPAAPVVSKAPPPVRSLAGAPVAGTPNPKEMNSISEWRRVRNEFGG
jgi:hypothetical protein